MIQYDPNDGMTLIGYRANGEKFTQSPMDSGYADMVNTRDAQLAAISANKTAKDVYLGALHNYQVSVDAGRPPATPAPTVPLFALVSDEGASSAVPWVPPLPVPAPPAVPTPATGIASQNAPYTATPGEKALLQALLSLGKRIAALEKAAGVPIGGA